MMYYQVSHPESDWCKCCFKPSGFRISRWHCQQFGLDGDINDLKQVKAWLETDGLVRYPTMLMKKWPINKSYFNPFDHPHWGTISDMVGEWPKTWMSYRRYITESITKAKEKL